MVTALEAATAVVVVDDDVLAALGLVAGRDDLLPELTQVASMWGLSANPFDCWLAERGLATLDLRVRAATRNAATLAAVIALRGSVNAAKNAADGAQAAALDAKAASAAGSRSFRATLRCCPSCAG